ncbi:helix-turn-helix domain-containing protein [Fusobacterium sp. PH5-44]|uniref:helix-turn-helix domain-containing protein n=1 Tax=unclassified Fusobacterium TaxID=2648384 RepID=UPI003D217D89
MNKRKAKSNFIQDSITLTKEIVEILKAKRKEIRFSLKEVSSEVKIPIATIYGYETKKTRNISRENYEKLLKFYNETEKKPEKRIVLDKGLIKYFNSQRKKRKFNRREFADEVGIPLNQICNIETGKNVTISKELYEKLINFYANEENYNKNQSRIPLTKKISKDFRRKRQESGFSRKELAQEMNIHISNIMHIECRMKKTVSKEVYKNFLNFFSNKDNYKKNNDKVYILKEGRTYVTEEMADFLKKERTKRGFTYNELANKLNLDKWIIESVENRKSRSLNTEIYEKLVNFYNDEKNYNKKGIKVSLSDEIKEYLKNKRKEWNFNYRELARIIGVKDNILRYIESEKAETTSTEIYEKLVNFYHNEENRFINGKEEKIFLTDEIKKNLREEREKRGYTNRELAKIFGVDDFKFYDIERQKAISKKFYERIIDFYKNEENLGIKVSLIEEKIKEWRREREKRGFTRKSLAKKIGITHTHLIYIEKGLVKSILRDIYKRFEDFFANEKNINKKGIRIPLTDEIREFMKQERKKRGFSFGTLEKKLGILSTLLFQMEKGERKSIDYTSYEKMMNFYKNVEISKKEVTNNKKNISSVDKDKAEKASKRKKRVFDNNVKDVVKRNKDEIILTDDIKTDIRTERVRQGYTREKFAKKIGIDQDIIFKIENDLIKSISKKDYGRFQEFCSKNNNSNFTEKNKLGSINNKIEKNPYKEEIILTKETISSLKDSREKLSLTYEIVEGKTGVSRTLLYDIESEKIKTVDKEIYEKLINFYNDTKNNFENEENKILTMISGKKNDVIPNTDRNRSILRSILNKRNETFYDFGAKLKISHYDMYQIDAGLSPTIPLTLYNEIMKLKKI